MRDPQARQDVMSTAVMLLIEAGLIKDAKAFALAEINKSSSPFYFMSILSQIEVRERNTTAALEWAKKAWMSSQGASTRLSWGTRYLVKILSLNPRDARSVVTTFEKIFGEIVNRPDAFSGRNRDYFAKLGKALKQWPDLQGRKRVWQVVKKHCRPVEGCQQRMQAWGFRA